MVNHTKSVKQFETLVKDPVVYSRLHGVDGPWDENFVKSTLTIGMLIVENPEDRIEVANWFEELIADTFGLGRTIYVDYDSRKSSKKSRIIQVLCYQ